MYKDIQDFKEYVNKLKKDTYFGRLGKTFLTKDDYYYYDTGTGKVAKIDEDVYKVLTYLLENNGSMDNLAKDTLLSEKRILEVFEIIEEAVESDNILSAPIHTGMIGPTIEELSENYKHVQNITLELTEDCNLRCKYCIYNENHQNFREFTKNKMSIETACKSIDFLYEHSSDGEEIFIGFYGGEPLVNFNLLKQCIEYANKTIKNRKVGYSMTTNATLLTEKISKFLIKNNVTVTISLDGPEEEHDENRIFINGSGSYKAVYRGILNIFNAAKEAGLDRPPIAFNMVNPGPDFEKKYKKMNDLFISEGWDMLDIPMITSAVETGPEKHDYIKPQSKQELELKAQIYDPLMEWVSEEKQRSNYERLFTDGTINKALVNIHNRYITDKPVKNIGLNGCCIPGQRRVFISTEGNFLPCEKVGNIPNLGNVATGFNLKKIKDIYFDQYIENSNKYCKDCWAINLCSLCYINCYEKEGADFSYRQKDCFHQRIFIEENLSMYHELTEKDPDSIKALNDIVIS